MEVDKRRNGDFQCDAKSKVAISEKLRYVIEERTPYTFTYTIDKNEVAGIDCYGVTTDGDKVIRTYAYECKSRYFTSTAWDEIMMEPHKYDELIKTHKEGKTSYFVNIFLDDVIMLWNVKDIDKNHTKLFAISKTTKGTTDKDKEKKLQPRIMLPVGKAIIIR